MTFPDDNRELEYGRVRPRSLRAVRWGVLSCLAVGVVGYGYWRSTIPTPAPAVSSLAVSPTTNAVVETPEERVDPDRVYRLDVAPLLDQFDARNRAAVTRALANMHERLNGRRWGIKPFVKDVGSWSTRFGVIGRTTSDLWNKHWKKQPNAAAVRTYVDDKFRHHVLSEKALEADMGEVLKQFREDLDASRNRLYIDVRLPLDRIRSPLTRSDVSFGAFQADVERR